jgi:hypothetical protein
MHPRLFPIAAVLACAATTLAASLSANSSPSTAITGDYVEVRTASVMAGPCHYNGELVTVGRDALLAWSFSAGTYRGTDLTGIRAIAAVTADDNLIETTAHKTELVVDPSASDAQVAALTALLREKCRLQLGSIVSLRRTPISFDHTATGYHIDAPGMATFQVQYRADNTCCVQPNLVWYDPLCPLEHRKVGFTDHAAYSGTIAPPWTRNAEDSAFYGTLAFNH